MKIISKYKDYYDGALSLGYDDYVRYIRDMKVIDIKNFVKFNPTRYYGIDYHFRSYCIIGFCGELYECLINNNLYERNYKEINRGFASDLKFEKCLYNREEILTNIVNHKYLVKSRYYDESKYLNKSLDDLIITQSNKLKSLFEEHKVPVFALFPHSEKLILNPILEPFDFYKIKPIHQAYQEIEVYLGNVLIENKEPIVPVGSDDVLLKSKGFDKLSFRKEKKLK